MSRLPSRPLRIALAAALATSSAARAELTLTDTTNIALAASQVEEGPDGSENPDVTGGAAGDPIAYAETGDNFYGCCGPNYEAHNLNDGDVGAGVPSDGTYAIADDLGAPVTLDLGAPVTVGSIAVYNGYANRDDGDYILLDGEGNTLGAWTIATGTGASNDGVDSYWLVFPTPVTTASLQIEYVVGDCCGTPSFREIQVFAPALDTDGDGMPDAFEDAFGLDKLDPGDAVLDGDADGLSNLVESAAGTDPGNPDSDGDGLQDGAEVDTHGTDPNNGDSDGDGLGDSAEVTVHLTNPNEPDSDGDGRPDGHEVAVPPLSDPLDADSDDDTFGDAAEVLGGSDPNDAGSAPVATVVFDASSLALENGAAVGFWAGLPAAGTPVFRTNQTPGGGPAVTFDGGANFGQAAVLASGTGDFVVAAVVRPDRINAYHNIVDDDNSDRPMLWVDFGNTWEFNFGSGTQGDTFSRPDAASGIDGWDIIIADSQTGDIYFNSGTTEFFAPPVPWFPFDDAEEFDFFHRDGGQAFQGQVAEVRVYNDPATFGGDYEALYEELLAKWVLSDDTDGDGMSDDFEDLNGLDKLDPGDAGEDPDTDGLDNLGEFEAKSNPAVADTDADGLNDGAEVNTHMTDPTLADSDGDGLTDGAEVNLHSTGPLQADSDGDGRSDGDEVNGDPVTDPLDADSDGDSYSDGTEVGAGTDPNDAGDFPSGPTFVLDATALGLADGAPVTEWGGQAASGNPVFRTGQTPGGGPAVEMDGGSHFGSIEPTVGPQGDFVIAAVIRPDDTFAYHNIIDDRARNRPMLWVDTSFSYELNFGGGDAPLAGGGAGGWDIVIADSRNNELYVNSPTPNGTGGGGVAYTVAEVFDLFHREGTDEEFSGLVAELRVYNDAGLFQGDFAALYDELAAKWLQAGPAAPLRIVSVSRAAGPGDVTFTWTSQGGASYRVQASFDGVSWFDLDDNFPSQGATTTFTDPGTNIPPGTRVRLYRVELLP
jgi:hypothetical protein